MDIITALTSGPKIACKFVRQRIDSALREVEFDSGLCEAEFDFALCQVEFDYALCEAEFDSSFHEFNVKITV